MGVSERQRAGARRPKELHCTISYLSPRAGSARVASTVHTTVPGNPRLSAGIPAVSGNVHLPATASCRGPCALGLEPEGGGGWVNTRRAALIPAKLSLAAHTVGNLDSEACLRRTNAGVGSVGFIDHDINLARPHRDGVTRISAVERAGTRRAHHTGRIDPGRYIQLPPER